MRGSLDVLLCTPLSTRSILAGKWWGSFRQTTHVLIWPAILAGMLVVQSGHWISYLLLLGLIMSYCAVITSLGLVMAIWVSRLGRAVALCVSAYVVFSIGWVVLIFLLSIPGQANDHFCSHGHGKPTLRHGLRHCGRRSRTHSLSATSTRRLRCIHLDRD